MPNRYKHDVEDADAEITEALRELIPALRNERPITYIIASLVDRLHRAHEHLKDIQFETEPENPNR